MMDVLAQTYRKGELSRHVEGLSVPEFAGLLNQATAECEQFLRVVEMSNSEAFESMLEGFIEAFTLKIGEILEADRVSLFLVDEAKQQIWSKVAQGGGEKPLDIRLPIGAGIAGHVALSGKSLNVPDAYDEPLFNRAVDQQTGYRTRSILCVPLADKQGRTIAVAQLLNKAGDRPFDAADERRMAEFAGSLGVVLESWWRMGRREGLGAGG